MTPTDPNYWTIISIAVAILVGIAAVGSTLWVYRKQSRVKRVEFTVDSSEALLSLDHSIRGKLQITFEGESVEQLYSHAIRILNTGNVALLPLDYASPLEIKWPNDFKPAAVSVGQRQPDNMQIDFVQGEDSILLPQVLLNPGDGYTITLLSQSPESPNLMGRLIEGNISEAKSSAAPFKFGEVALLTFCYLVTFSSFVFLLTSTPNVSIFIKVFLHLISLSISCVLTITINMEREIRRWGRLSPRSIRRLSREQESPRG